MRVIGWILFLLLVTGGLGAQEPVQLADRGPRFLLASTTATEPTVVDASGVAVLRKRISLDLEGVTLEEALTAISRQAELRLMYSKGGGAAGEPGAAPGQGDHRRRRAD